MASSKAPLLTKEGWQPLPLKRLTGWFSSNLTAMRHRRSVSYVVILVGKKKLNALFDRVHIEPPRHAKNACYPSFVRRGALTTSVQVVSGSGAWRARYSLRRLERRWRSSMVIALSLEHSALPSFISISPWKQKEHAALDWSNISIARRIRSEHSTVSSFPVMYEFWGE